MSSQNLARNSPPGDTQHNVRDAALRGASSAFSKPPLKPKPQTNTYTGGKNGALLAATKVGSPGGQQTSTPAAQGSSPLSRREWTGEVSSYQQRSQSSSSSTLAVRDTSSVDRTPSPSNIAAKLAASRHHPLKPVSQPNAMTERDLARLESRIASQQARRDSFGSLSVASNLHTPLHDRTDESSIPPTTALVSMFEQKKPNAPVAPVAKPPTLPLVKSPRPQRRINLPIESGDDAPAGQIGRASCRERVF